MKHIELEEFFEHNKDLYILFSMLEELELDEELLDEDL
jgi:hypothetical protein